MMLTGPSGRTVGVAASNVQQVDQAVTAWTRAATTVLGTTLNGTLSATGTTITAFNGVAGVTYHVRCLGVGAITHHATDLIVTQGGASITATAAGDTFDVEMITATTCRIKNYLKADGTPIVAATDAMIYRGATDCSANPNYPAGDAGDTYRVSVAGKIGGASGVTVDVGDFFICNTDGTAAGDQATVGTKWDVFQANLVGALVSGGALGTPSSGTLTNCTGLPENGLTLADVTSANASTTTHGFVLKATAPAAGLYNFVGITNGETAYSNKALFDATDPSTQAYGDAAAVGTAAVAARRDHKHAMPAAITDSTISISDTTSNNATTSAHGFVVKATAPAAGLINVVGIANLETAYTNKALFDASDPSTQAYGDAAATGTATVAARRDHKHAMPAIASDATLTFTDTTSNNASTTLHGFAPKVVAPSAGNLNVVGVANGETVYANKGLLDTTSPSTQALGDAAAAGTSLVAARVDHKHAMSSSFSTPATDHTSRGPTTNVYAAGEAITVMDLVILNSSAQWVQTDANTAALYAGMLAISLESQGAGSAMNVALPGSIVRDDTWNWTAGSTLYMSETAAAITVTAPTTAGSAVRSIGFALNADLVWFGPSNTYTVNA